MVLTKRHSYRCPCSVSLRTPNLVAWRNCPFVNGPVNVSSDLPPVPTTNSRMPCLRVARLRGRLEGVALVDVVVAAQDDVDVVRVEHLPERVVIGQVSVGAGGEPGVVPVGERARRMVGGEVVLEPRHLPRRRAAAADVRAVRVERDQVPLADVVAVPAPGRACPARAAEVGEVAGAVRARRVLVVSRDGVGLPERAAPAERRRRPGSPASAPVSYCSSPSGRTAVMAGLPRKRSAVLTWRQVVAVDHPAGRAGDVARGGDDRRFRIGRGRRPQDRRGGQHRARRCSPSASPRGQGSPAVTPGPRTADGRGARRRPLVRRQGGARSRRSSSRTGSSSATAPRSRSCS